MIDLLVCIRCHDYPSMVLDTVHSVYWSCGKRNVRVVCAVDGFPNLAKKLVKHLGKENVFCSKTNWGWGAGLYSLLIESIVHFDERIKYSHFLSIDYDTLFIAKHADIGLLSYIVGPGIGLVGCHAVTNLHWAHVFTTERANLEKVFGRIPNTFTAGEGVQGGCMLLTRMLIDTMRKRGRFERPFSEAKKHTSIADDHLLPIFVRQCGFEIVDASAVARCEWKATEDPRGLEKKGIRIIHPAKLRPGSQGTKIETEIRNYFRRIRSQPLL